MLLQGKTAIITGCNRGIGHTMVEVFAREGANIWAHAREETLDFIEDMKSIGQRYDVKIIPVFFELTNKDEIKSALKIIMSSKSSIDILVNNAGIVGENRLFQMTSIEDMKKVFEVNFFAPTLITQYIFRFMVRQNQGCIINMASIAGIDGDPAQYEYSASKAALIGATKKLAIELGKSGIRVNAIAPGLTETRMAQNMRNDMMQDTIDKTILKRLARPEEIANVVAFMASDFASYMTGQVVRVDGGKL